MQEGSYLLAENHETFCRLLNAINADTWELIDDNEFFHKIFFKYNYLKHKYAIITSGSTSMVDIFFMISTEQSFETVIGNILPDVCVTWRWHPYNIEPRKSYCYKVLAAYVFIIECRYMVLTIEPGNLDHVVILMKRAIKFLFAISS